jgi:hypothetical protein
MHKDFDRVSAAIRFIHPLSKFSTRPVWQRDTAPNATQQNIGPYVPVPRRSVSPFDLGRLKTKFPYILLVPQSRFLEFIAGEAAQYPSFRLVMRRNVRKFVEEKGVICGVRYLR